MRTLFIKLNTNLLKFSDFRRLLTHHKIVVASANLLLLAVLSCLGSCSTLPPNPVTPADPLEPLNRNTTRFNDKLDKAIIRPVARAYLKITPYFLRHSLDNFFTNFGSVIVISNDILQGEGRWALSDSWRFVINTTVGIGGIFDPAKHIGLQAHRNDFGLTLNRWHIYTPYFVMPFLGPNTIGGAIGIVPDYYLSCEASLIPLNTSVMLKVANSLNSRAILLQRQDQTAGLVLDPYTFYRSAYLQYRQHLHVINTAGPQFGQNAE
jgi:phospholipid-binding lipoprotein MlaA